MNVLPWPNDAPLCPVCGRDGCEEHLVIRPDDDPRARTACERGLDPEGLADATVVAAEGQAIAAHGVPYLVDGLVPAYGMVGMLVAFSKVGKTTFGQHLAASVATGRPFLDRPTQQARVLILAAEDPPEYTAWLARHLDVPPDVLTFYRRPHQLNEAGLAQIIATIHEGHYGAVLISSWQAVVSQEVRDENDNAASVKVVERVKAATRETHIPWVIDAHSGKGEDQSDDADPSRAMRGASSAAGAADYTLSLRYANGPFGSRRKLSGKGRFVSFAPLVLDYDVESGAFTVVGDSAANKAAMAETTWLVLRETGAIGPTLRTVDAIARAAGFVSPAGRVTGAGRRKVYDALHKREGVRTVTEIRRGQEARLYALTEAT